jgi:hypothetical protein
MNAVTHRASNLAWNPLPIQQLVVTDETVNRENIMIMKRYLLQILLGGALTLSQAASAVDITINDQLNNSAFGVDSRGISEDGSVTAGCVANQSWDMEAFVVQAGKLIVIGGFDMRNGVYDSGWNQKWQAGDVFFDVGGATVPVGPVLPGGNGWQTYQNGDNGYEYALDIDWANLKFNVVKLTAGSVLQSGYFRQNDKANPYGYLSGGIDKYTGNTVGYTVGLTDAQVLSAYGVDLKGGTHNVAEFDMSWWGTEGLGDSSMVSHLSLSCNNDLIVGQVIGGYDNGVPDGGSSILLMALGLATCGFGVIRRRVS